MKFLWIFVVLGFGVGGYAFTSKQIETQSQNERTHKLTTEPPLEAYVRTLEADVPPGKAEIDDFGKKIAKALQDCELKELSRFLDMKGIVERAVSNAKTIPLNSEEEFSRQSQEKLWTQYCQTLENTEISYLRTREKKEVITVLLRLVHPAGWNYYDVYIRRSPETKNLYAYDIYSYNVAIHISEIFAGVINAAVDTGASERDAALKTMEMMTNHLRAKNYLLAHRELQKLSKHLQNTKTNRAFAILIASHLDEKTYHAAIADYEAEYPEDPSLDLAMYNHFYLEKEWDKSLEAIKRFEKRIGGDPLLNLVAGNIMIEKKEYKEAAKLFTKAQEAGFQNQELSVAMFHNQVLQGNFDEAIRHLRVLSLTYKADVSRSILMQDEKYSDFINSPQYKKWEATQN